MDKLQLLTRTNKIVISEFITLKIPTLEEIYEYGELQYFSSISLFCSTPSDNKLLLYDEMGIDWVDLSDYEWFRMIYNQFDDSFYDLIFDDVNLKSLFLAMSDKDKTIHLIDEFGNSVINESIYNDIVDLLRYIHNITKNVDNPGNQTTHDHLLKKERKREKRRKLKQQKQESLLFPIMCSLVNSSNFKYNYDTVWNLNVFQLFESLKRIKKIYDFNQFMTGIYSGMVDTSKMSADTINERVNWCGNLK